MKSQNGHIFYFWIVCWNDITEILKPLKREMQVITMFSVCQLLAGQPARFNENDLVDPSFLDSLKMAQSVFDQECFIAYES